MMFFGSKVTKMVVQPLEEVVKEVNSGTSSPISEHDEGNDNDDPTLKVQVDGVDAVTDIKRVSSKPQLSTLAHEGPVSAAIRTFTFTQSHTADKSPGEG